MNVSNINKFIASMLAEDIKVVLAIDPFSDGLFRARLIDTKYPDLPMLDVNGQHYLRALGDDIADAIEALDEIVELQYC